MILESKYNIGQEVYWVTYQAKETYIICDRCDGTKYYNFKREKIYCNKCTYDGYIKTTSPIQFIVKGPFTVGQIKCIAEDNQKKVEYMMNETGLRSGQLYIETSLFDSQEKANNIAEELNKSKITGEEYYTYTHEWEKI